jgi:hypothetical protein
MSALDLSGPSLALSGTSAQLRTGEDEGGGDNENDNGEK